MTSELTVTERAQKALSTEHTEAELRELAGKYVDVIEIKDDTDYELVKRAAISLGAVRISIEKSGKAARDDANKFSKAVIAEERRLIGIIGDEETRLKGLRKAVDDEAARLEEVVRQAEVVRIESIMGKISAIKALAQVSLGSNAEKIAALLGDALAIVPDEEGFAEFAGQASAALTGTTGFLHEALVERRAIEDQQAEQERIAKEQADRQAALDEQAAEQRQAQEKIEQEQAEAARVAQEAKDRAEADKLAAEREAAEKVRLENERLEREAREAAEAEEREKAAEAEAERQEAMRPDKGKLTAWAEELRYIEGPRMQIDSKLCEALRIKCMRAVNQAGMDLLKALESL